MKVDIIKSWEDIVSFSNFDRMNLIDKDSLLTETLNQIKIKSPEHITDKNILFLNQSLLST